MIQQKFLTGMISILSPTEERWMAYLSANPQSNIFHHPDWARLLEASYGYRPFVIALCDTADVICAGLPMMEVDGLLANRRWISLPFTDHCTPLYHNADALSCLTNNLVNLFQDFGTPRIELRCEFPPHPAIRSWSHQVLHTLPLCPDFDSLTARFHSTHRRNIKVAIKRGVHIELGQKREHLRVFYRLHLQTRRRQGIPIQPWRFFDLLGSTLIEKGLGFVMLAYKDDECLAAAVFLNWKRTLTYKYGASAADGLNSRPNNLLFSTAIRWGCENGYTLFDMGKTDLDNTGLRAFKSGWGAEETPLYYSTKSTEPPRSYTSKLMPIMQIVIRHSPDWVCRIAGELLYKHFGS